MKKSVLLFMFSLIFSSSTYSINLLNYEYQELIKDLVKKNPKQLTFEEYSVVAEAVIRKAPCNILVFGVGKDSTLWIDLNKNGCTVFLEDNSIWFDYAKKHIPDINVYLVKYGTKKRHWHSMLKKRDPRKLMLALPPELISMTWDLIFVDGPAGFAKNSPGRMKSIFTASQLAFAHNNIDVFVHDCDRIIEQKYTDVFLLPSNLKETLGKLRHYHIKK